MSAKVLLIDDEADVRLYLGAALEDHGYDVLLMEDSSRFLETVRAERPDVICLDLMMPVRTGFTLHRQLLEDPELRLIPTVLITGVPRAGELVALELESLPGCGTDWQPAGILEKPIQISELLEMVGRAARPSAGEDHGAA
ncbi:MAG: response regulator [bacterium]